MRKLFIIFTLTALPVLAIESGDLQMISIDAAGNNFGGLFSKKDNTPLDGSEGSTTTETKIAVEYGKQISTHIELNLLISYDRSETESSNSNSSTRTIEFAAGAGWNFSSDLSRTFTLAAWLGFAPTKITEDNAFTDGTNRFVQFDLGRRFNIYDREDFALCYAPKFSYRTTSYGGDFANVDQGNLDSDSQFTVHFLAFDILF